MTQQIRVMIVDDHEIVREGLRALVHREPTMCLVGEGYSAASAIAEAKRTQPDVIVMDVRLGDGSGIEACREIRAYNSAIKVMMLTSYPDEEAVFASILAGASGYLLKQTRRQTLIEAIAAVARGESLGSDEQSAGVPADGNADGGPRAVRPDGTGAADPRPHRLREDEQGDRPRADAEPEDGQELREQHPQQDELPATLGGRSICCAPFGATPPRTDPLGHMRAEGPVGDGPLSPMGNGDAGCRMGWWKPPNSMQPNEASVASRRSSSRRTNGWAGCWPACWSAMARCG